MDYLHTLQGNIGRAVYDRVPKGDPKGGQEVVQRRHIGASWASDGSGTIMGGHHGDHQTAVKTGGLRVIMAPGLARLW